MLDKSDVSDMSPVTMSLTKVSHINININTSIFTPCLKNVAYLMFCNLKKLEPIIMFLAHNFLIILAVKSIHNFISNLAWVSGTLQLNVSVLLRYSNFWFFFVLVVWYSSEYICTFLLRDADTHSALLRQRGWLGGWLPVTCRYYIKTAKPILKLFANFW